MKVLLIEDDMTLGPGLKTGLEKAGFFTEWATSLADAEVMLDHASFDALLLDLSLPDGDGMSLLKRLRRQRQAIPIMVVTARSHREARIEGLDEGADDYVTKPYDLDELVARLRAVVRRSFGQPIDLLRFGVFELDIKGRVVTRDSIRIPLKGREIRVLSILAQRAGRWVSKAEIENTIYEDGKGIESNTVETAVYALRKKLGLGAIITARGLGYMVSR